MLELAEKLALLKGSYIMSHAIREDKITFVLGSGPKLKDMTIEDLKNEIALFDQALTPSKVITPELVEKIVKSKKKGVKENE